MEQPIAHIKADSSGNFITQSLEQHSRNVAELAAEFASEFGFGPWAEAMGLLHDLGKARTNFQSYVKYTSGFDTSISSWGDKNHAFIGAIAAQRLYGGFATLMSNEIMGHHAGLYDYPELEKNMKESLPAEIKDFGQKLSLPTELLRNFDAKDYHHLVRMLFSCLVDADRLDTEDFMTPSHSRLRQGRKTIAELKPLLDAQLERFKAAPATVVNVTRQRVQERCFEESTREPGFFSLTVPTGGGKTIASMVWALNHATKYGKKRIVIAIPYTSIIVQTAETLRKIFGKENVLEHHSNVDYESRKEDDDPYESEMAMRLQLATENWDYPIVVTTNVQFFESMFSNRPSDCRKLHNLANSVIILDEAQTLPLEFLQPIVDGLQTYVKCFGASVLFTTASQPALQGDFKGAGIARLHGIGAGKIHEIIPVDYRLHNTLRRVKIAFDDETTDYASLAKRLSQHPKVLCVVNTRRDAQLLYEQMPKEGLLHLSRMMCPLHLTRTIAEIKKRLLDPIVSTLRVISTQLIEAGVDIDFPEVYRQIAGLDSILQATGRCNREGRLKEIPTAHVFCFAKPLPQGYISNAGNAMRTLLNIDAGADWLAADVMHRYFEQLYCRTASFDKADVEHLLDNPRELCFEQASQRFKLIDDRGVPVVVNYGDSMAIAEPIKHGFIDYQLIKKLAQYTVTISERDYGNLKSAGLIEDYLDCSVHLMPDACQYSEDVGVIVDNHWTDEILIK